MINIFRRLFEVVFVSPYMLIAFALVLVMILASLAATFAIPMMFLETLPIIMTQGMTLKVAGLLLLAVVMSLGVAALTYVLTWASVKGALWMAKGFVKDVQSVATAVNEVRVERAERAEALEAKGCMLSMSVGDGAGGGLTQTAHTGLEVVEKGVTLDLDGAVEEDEDSERAQPVVVDVS